VQSGHFIIYIKGKVEGSAGSWHQYQAPLTWKAATDRQAAPAARLQAWYLQGTAWAGARSTGCCASATNRCDTICIWWQAAVPSLCPWGQCR